MIATAMLAVPWNRLPRLLLLVWPMGLLVTVAVAGLATPAGSVATLSGLTVMAYFHIGRFQRKWTGFYILPFAVVALIACYGGITHQLELRAPITIGVWVIVSESLARLQEDAQSLADVLDLQAATDTLTGLATRQVLNDRLSAAGVGDALVMIDIDHFKDVNDRYGHMVGDRVLADLGALLLATVRVRDVAIRFGGEELVLVLAGAREGGALSTLERIRDTWSRSHPDVTFSAGIALVSDGLDTTSTLVAADKALYAAKDAGRDCWFVSNQEGEAARSTNGAPGSAIDPERGEGVVEHPKNSRREALIGRLRAP